MKLTEIWLICVVSLGGLTTSSLVHSQPISSDKPEVRLNFGVVPQQSASKLARLWRPVLQHLEAATGYKLLFNTAKSIPVFEQRLKDGIYDIAYMNPYHYTSFHENPGYQAIAKQKNKRIKGIVVVRKDSPLQSIEDLDQQTLAFPAPAAFAASVLPRAYFVNQGLTVIPKYVSSHDSVYLSVAKGLFPAGGGVMRTFNNMDIDIRDQLKILWHTQEYTPHALAVHPRVPSEIKRALQQAMINMNDDPNAMQALQSLNFAGFESAEDADWNDVRELGISLLDHLINN